MQPQSEDTQLSLLRVVPTKIAKRTISHESSPLVDSTYIGIPPAVDVQENLTTLSLGVGKINPYAGIRSTRGNVVAFSKSSRLRLQRTLSAVRWSTLSPPTWCTLTYHHARDVDSAAAVHDLQRWLDRIEAKVGKCHYIWRLEMQVRGVPHFHVILWPPNDAAPWQRAPYRSWLADQWHAVVSPGDKAHAKHGAKIDALDSYRHASRYISKYVAKEPNVDGDTYRGRRWATSHGLPRDVISSTDLSRRAALLLRRHLRRYVRSTARNRRRADQYVMGHTTIRIFIPYTVVSRLLIAVREEMEGGQEGSTPWAPGI